jgi:hypothetical protein
VKHLPIPQPPSASFGRHSPSVPVIDNTTLELLAKWRTQDWTEDPEELRAAEEELAEFKTSMNESRVSVGAPPVYP